MNYIKRKPDGEFGFRFFERSFLHSLLKNGSVQKSGCKQSVLAEKQSILG